MQFILRRLLPVLAALAIPAGCVPGGPTEGAATVNVLAAVSLREVFTDLAAEFERGDPTTRVRIAFGPSDALATQIVEGAIADVFAPAHPRWLDLVARHRAIVDRALLGRNTLVIALADGLRGRVRTIDDLARPGLRLVVAARSVPAGEYADTVLSRTGDTGALDNVVSREIDVKGVIQKVLLGEADAGLAYRTDLASGPAARLDRIEIPEEFNVRAEYPIAVLTDGPSPGAARRFVAFVLGPGQARLRAAGFLPPC